MPPYVLLSFESVAGRRHVRRLTPSSPSLHTAFSPSLRRWRGEAPRAFAATPGVTMPLSIPVSPAGRQQMPSRLYTAGRNNYASFATRAMRCYRRAAAEECLLPRGIMLATIYYAATTITSAGECQMLRCYRAFFQLRFVMLRYRNAHVFRRDTGSSMACRCCRL